MGTRGEPRALATVEAGEIPKGILAQQEDAKRGDGPRTASEDHRRGHQQAPSIEPSPTAGGKEGEAGFYTIPRFPGGPQEQQHSPPQARISTLVSARTNGWSVCCLRGRTAPRVSP